MAITSLRSSQLPRIPVAMALMALVAVFLVHGINLDLAGDGVYNFTLRVENRGHGYQTAHLFPVGRNCNMNLRDSPLLVVDLVYDALLVESACDEVIYRVI